MQFRVKCVEIVRTYIIKGWLIAGVRCGGVIQCQILVDPRQHSLAVADGHTILPYKLREFSLIVRANNTFPSSMYRQNIFKSNNFTRRWQSSARVVACCFPSNAPFFFLPHCIPAHKILFFMIDNIITFVII